MTGRSYTQMSIRLLTVKITVMQIRELPTHSFWKKAVSMEGKTPKVKFCHKKSTSLVATMAATVIT